MSILTGITHFFQQATKVADQATAFFKAPLDFIAKPLAKAVSGLAARLPFGLGAAVKPFVEKFLPTAESWIARGPLAGFFSLLARAAPTAQKIDDALHVADRLLEGGLAGLPQPALSNVIEGVAHAQASQVNASTTVTPGQRVEKTLKVPCSLDFDIKGVNPVGGNGDKAHLAWAYSTAFNGGNVSPGGGFVFGARDYKVKEYDKDGQFIRDQRYSVAWDPTKTYHVHLSVEANRTVYSVSQGGQVLATVQLQGAAPARVTLGYGWPPSQRPGVAGATVSNATFGGEP